MTTLQAGMFVAGYSIIIAAPAAIVLWGLARRPLAYSAGPATYLATLFAAALVAPVWAGYAFDLANPNEICNGHCYEFTRTWFAMPLGWALGGPVAAGALFAAPVWRRPH